MRLRSRHRISICCLLVGAVLAATACTSPPISSVPAHEVALPDAASTTGASFGSTETLMVGHSVTFADGLIVALDKVNDSRCTAAVQCVWAGELAPELRLRGGNVGAPQTVLLGMERARKRTLAGYELALLNASADSAMLEVTKDTAPTPGGTVDHVSGVHGLVTIGPTCPVERMPPDPKCRDKPFAATFSIETVADAHVATVASGADGTFSLELRPGNYVIRLQSTGVMPLMAPQDFTIKSNARTQLHLTLDSGIR